ncbi:MAG: ABC transporter permease [Nitrospirota bacterium]
MIGFRPPFALILARRNLRAGSRHHVPIAAAIALGVGAVVAIGAAADTARRAIAGDAKSLLAADLELRSTAPLSNAGAAAVGRLASQGARVTRVAELMAMAVVPGRSVLVELKAVEGGYPFYGRVETEPDRALASWLTAGPPLGAVVHEAFLIRLGLSLGDRFRLGEAEFTAVALLRAEPDRTAGAFSLGPRVLIAREALDLTGLVRPGSRVRYRALIALPPDAEPADRVRDAVREELAAEPVQITAYADAQPRLRRSLDRVGAYLGLVGVTALLLGGVGVAGSARALVADRWRTIALLKCVGADARTVAWATLAELAALGLAGGVLGAGLGALGQRALTAAASAFAGITLTAPISPWPYAQGALVGGLAGVGFSLGPLSSAARAPAAAVLRHEAAPLGVSWLASWRLAAIGLSAAFGLGWWQTRSLGLAALYLAGLAAAAAVLAAAAWCLARLTRALPTPSSFAWRRGVGALTRPGAHTAAAMVSIGLGVTAVAAVGFVDRAIRAELTEHVPRDAPTLFFIDIQPDQRDGFTALADARGIPAEVVPVARGRLRATGDQPATSGSESGGESDARWYLTREYVVTARADLPRGNTVVEGRWWDGGASTASSEVRVSVERELAHRLGIGVGAMIGLDIHGTSLDARVTSLRSVDWDNRGLNFFLLLSPGALDDMPVTYVAAVRAATGEQVAMQQAVVEAFPNVTAIPIGEVLASVERVVERVSFAVRGVAVLVAVAGFVVLGGALAAARAARLRDAMLLKTIGAGRPAMLRALAVEFGLVGAASGLLGTGLAAALSWMVARWVLEVPWVWAADLAIIGPAASMTGTMAVGLSGTYRLLGKRPFAVLRGD